MAKNIGGGNCESRMPRDSPKTIFAARHLDRGAGRGLGVCA